MAKPQKRTSHADGEGGVGGGDSEAGADGSCLLLGGPAAADAMFMYANYVRVLFLVVAAALK